MKKLFLVATVILAFAVQSKAQHTAPWFPYEGNTKATGSNLSFQGVSVLDTAGTGDTVWLDLSAVRTQIYLNRGVRGDSLHGTVTLALIDTTIAGRRYRTSQIYRDWELQVEYKTPSAKRDTIKFSGLFNTGTAVGYIISPSDTVQHTHYLHFKFDGAKFFQTCTGK